MKSQNQMQTHKAKKKNKDKSNQILKQKFLTVWCHVRLPVASQVTTFFIFTFN